MIQERYGKAMVKFNHNDPKLRSILVQQDTEGQLWYWHPTYADWYLLPTKWEKKIRWNNPAGTAG